MLGRETIVHTNVAINVKKVDNRRLKNCVNLLTCWQVSYERTTEPFKETYGETFWRRLISFERRNDGENIAIWDEN